jgi:hypothetical protein
MMSPLEISSAEDSKYYSPTSTDSSLCIQRSSCQMASNMEANEGQHAKEMRSVINSTTRDVKQPTVGTVTPVRHAEAPLTEKQIAILPPGIEQVGKRPKYLRYHIWDPDGTIADVRGRLTLRQNIPRSQVNINMGINPAALPRYIPTNMCLPQGCRDRGNM